MNEKINFISLEKPFVLKLGFDKLIEELNNLDGQGCAKNNAYVKSVLSDLKDISKLKDGFLNSRGWQEYEADIYKLLSFLFPDLLSENEIKVALPPFSPNVLFASKRFKSIFGEIDQVEAKEVMAFNADNMYILMCKLICKLYYNVNFRVDVRTVYQVTDGRGVVKFYKSTYNADFMTLTPLGEPPVLTESDISILKANDDNVELWKEYFPPLSWEVRGFGIKSFVDVSHEEAIGKIKSILLNQGAEDSSEKSKGDINSMMSTLLNTPGIEGGFLFYDNVNESFHTLEEEADSFAIEGNLHCSQEELLCHENLRIIFEVKGNIVIPDIESISDESKLSTLYINLKKKDIKSYLMVPLFNKGELLGVIEIASRISQSLDPTAIMVVNRVKDLFLNTVKRLQDESENQLSSIIQREFTSIHPSVAWRFREEARTAIHLDASSEKYDFPEISFRSLTALYGQSDIAGSSVARNNAIESDLSNQMGTVQSIVKNLKSHMSMPLLDSIIYQITIINEKLDSDLAAGMEQEVLEFLRNTINPLFNEMRHRDHDLSDEINDYFDRIGENKEVIYDKRKDYDDTVNLINQHLSSRLDAEQKEAQEIYPHFFERYKTDGVDHNMYIGQEIAPKIPFNKLYLDNLRLWQLKTMCQLEIEHRQRMSTYPMPLEIATLIMVYSTPLAIKYRMDEKQFDVDGAYNARYEIIKKRIDKAHIKNTKERITQVGKIVIIYTQAVDLEHYLNYVSFLTYEGYFLGEPESFDVEDLEGVVGLKALRLKINFDRDKAENEAYTNEPNKKLV
jgi:hypothetical protein